MVNYTLYYFPIRARGEIARQIFAVTGQKYEDVRIPREKWSEWQKKMPYGQLPVLEEDGKMLAQSHSIARYLARKFGLAGKSPWEEAQVDSLADQWKDFQTETRSFWIAYTGRGGNLEKLKQDVFLPATKKHFPFYVNAIKNSGSGYFVGSSLTYVDLLISEFIAGFDEFDKKILDDFPALRDHKNLVRNIPSLKKWIEFRPQSAF